MELIFNTTILFLNTLHYAIWICDLTLTFHFVYTQPKAEYKCNKQLLLLIDSFCLYVCTSGGRSSMPWTMHRTTFQSVNQFDVRWSKWIFIIALTRPFGFRIRFIVIMAIILLRCPILVTVVASTGGQIALAKALGKRIAGNLQLSYLKGKGYWFTGSVPIRQLKTYMYILDDFGTQSRQWTEFRWK